MKLASIRLQDFKRFTDVTIRGLPESTKLVVLVGANGSGKSSLFEAFRKTQQQTARVVTAAAAVAMRVLGETRVTFRMMQTMAEVKPETVRTYFETWTIRVREPDIVSLRDAVDQAGAYRRFASFNGGRHVARWPMRLRTTKRCKGWREYRRSRISA
jgi:recombinational DNA repair ATPase RecF